MMEFDSHRTKSPSSIVGTLEFGLSALYAGVLTTPYWRPASIRSTSSFNSSASHITFFTLEDEKRPHTLIFFVIAFPFGLPFGVSRRRLPSLLTGPALHPSVPIPKFVSPCGTLSYELRVRGTSLTANRLETSSRTAKSRRTVKKCARGRGPFFRGDCASWHPPPRRRRPARSSRSGS